MESLSELDKGILRVLAQDVRATNRDVAEAIGVSPTTALERTRALRRRGVILGATLELDLGAIGRPVQAMIAVKLRPPTRPNLEKFRDWMISLPQVLSVFATSGTEDFLVHVAVPTVEGLYHFTIDNITSSQHVSDVRTSVIYEHTRNHDLMPVGPSRARQ